MSTVEIKQLFSYSRFSESPSKIGLLLIYIPVGITLFILRTLLALLLYFTSFILPNAPIFHNIVYKLSYISLGIIVNVENIEKKEEADGIVTNKVSYFDSMVINSVAKCITPGIYLNTFLSSAFGIHYFKSTNNIEELKRDLSNVVSESKVPIYFQPESIITNGRALLKFSIWPFTLCNKVQPVTITINRPGLDIPISTIYSGYWSDLFFFMFVPCTVYRIKFLPAVEKKGLSEETFINKVRLNIANDLKVKLSNYSAADLKEYVKRYRAEQQRNISTQNQTIGTINPEIHRMSIQVREVLPLVPYDAIYKDLIKTKSVDLTITNILEGHVSYVPEQSKPSSSSSNSPTKSTASSSSGSIHQTTNTSLNTAAPVFGKSPQERSISFQERKRLLIENSRKRYIEKHSLSNIVGS
ncbi:hypothetical protein AMK59_3061 [Oryctes borbonicus]|uniref:Lipid droplet-regulating VLDL assembly factor AUP1 n=1 Tax=Oryctes borbonicus TaxID=1629725 RepID=A0A0T6B5Y3_9SCAR|nr:hypothetical protein AMK59_3061 [Oryctes borbonicus]